MSSNPSEDQLVADQNGNKHHGPSGRRYNRRGGRPSLDVDLGHSDLDRWGGGQAFQPDVICPQ